MILERELVEISSESEEMKQKLAETKIYARVHGHEAFLKFEIG